MQLFRDIDSLPDSVAGCAVAIGNFDGVHLGHVKIISTLKERAEKVGGRCGVFTFDPHPVRLLRPQAAPIPICWPERKTELLAQLGIDFVVVFPTTRQFLELTPDEFFQQIVVDRLRAKSLVEGPNFYFGKDRKGDVQYLRHLCREHSIDCTIVEPVFLEDRIVSSSEIRKLIRASELALANRMLTRPHRIRGRIAHGAGRGSGLGFPTANLDEVDVVIPGEAVYAGIAHLKNETWPAAVNVGKAPTFSDPNCRIEAHLVGFDDSIYGEQLQIDFIKKLRDIRRFDNPKALSDQLKNDVAASLQTYRQWLAMESKLK